MRENTQQIIFLGRFRIVHFIKDVKLTDFLYQNEGIIRLSAFLVGFFSLALWEWVSPKRELTQVRLKRWINNFVLVICGTIAVRLLVPVAVISIAYLAEKNHWGLANNLDISLWLKIVIAFVLLDLAIYFQHATFHTLPILWRIHRVHHSDLDCDVSTGLRFHPVEILISILIKFIAILVIGAPVISVILFEIVLNFMSMFTHSNIHLNKPFERALRWFIVTPDMHRLHHSNLENETNSNFGFNISLWDRVFGTYMAKPKDGQLGMTIGLSEFQKPKWQGIKGLLRMPYTAGITGYAINYRDTRNTDELAAAKKLAEKHLENSELTQKLASYIEAVNQNALVSVTDLAGRIIEINDKFCEVSGYSKDELLGKNHRIIKSNVHDKTIYTELWTAISNGNTWHGEICNKAKDGSLYWVDSSIVPIKDADNRIDRYISIRFDITNRKQAEHELIELNVKLEDKVEARTKELTLAKTEAEKANTAKSVFLSNMSHELRTPLNAIIGYTEILMEDDDRILNDHARKDLNNIYGAGRHLLNLIGDVLDLARLESDRVLLSIESVDMRDILNDALLLIKTLANQRSIEIIDNISPDLSLVVRGDSRSLKSVLLNLMSNAVKYNKEEGTITLDARVVTGGMLRLSITDTGQGLTNEQQKELFIPFNRAGVSDAIEGTGIGLTISKKLVTLMGGSIGNDSVLGKSTTFWFEVPTSDESKYGTETTSQR